MKFYDSQPRKMSDTKRGREIIVTVLLGIAVLSYTCLHYWLVDEHIPTWLSTVIIGMLWIGIPCELELCVTFLSKLIWRQNKSDDANKA